MIRFRLRLLGITIAELEVDGFEMAAEEPEVEALQWHSDDDALGN